MVSVTDVCVTCPLERGVYVVFVTGVCVTHPLQRGVCGVCDRCLCDMSIRERCVWCL